MNMEVLSNVLAAVIVLAGGVFLRMWQTEKKRRLLAESVINVLLKNLKATRVEMYKVGKTGETVVLVDGKEIG